MPTYEYRCPEGHDFEHFVLRMSEGSGTLPCPTCGAVAERRISAGGGLLFKGSGFYITDYGKDGKKDQRDKSTADAKKASAASTAGASDAKTTKPAESKPAPAAPTPSSGKSDA
ncbi:MAG: zinc ribbon domain-containing protein [Gemmatimonadetes bacterium]|nr:zinc ribbon domain-containing protein [Gemmatimonadota bacterium]